LQHVATFTNADAALVGHIRVPDGVLGIEADSVGNAVAEVSPYPPIRQAAVGGDVASCRVTQR
jgi:hypothetical protein